MRPKSGRIESVPCEGSPRCPCRDASKCVPFLYSGTKEILKGTSADNGKGKREPNHDTFAL
jgi:hypothetical protein